MATNSDEKNQLARTTALLGGISIVGAIGLGMLAAGATTLLGMSGAIAGAMALGAFGLSEAFATATLLTSKDNYAAPDSAKTPACESGLCPHVVAQENTRQWQSVVERSSDEPNLPSK